MCVRKNASSTSDGAKGTKIGGDINISAGIGLMILPRSIGGRGSPSLCGVVPGLIGIAMLVYVYVLAGPLDEAPKG